MVVLTIMLRNLINMRDRLHGARRHATAILQRTAGSRAGASRTRTALACRSELSAIAYAIGAGFAFLLPALTSR